MLNPKTLFNYALVASLPLAASPAIGDYTFSGSGNYSLNGAPAVSGPLSLTGLATSPASIGSATLNTIFGRGSVDAFVFSGPGIQARSASGGDITQLITGPASPLGGPSNTVTMGGISMALPGSVDVLSGRISVGGTCTDCSSELALLSGGTLAFTFSPSISFTNTVPEPPIFALLATALGVLGWRMRTER